MPNTGDECTTAGSYRCGSCGEVMELEMGQFPECPVENKAVEWEEAVGTTNRPWQELDGEIGRSVA